MNDHARTRDFSVDIIVNNYNYGRFLADAVDSALAQSHPNVNVIVVDDGSTDDSRTILQRYRDRVELVFKVNGGQASALNAGFARSNGDAVIFLDSDDLLEPTAASLVAAAFSANPGAVKVQYRMEVVDREGRPTGVVKPPPHLPLPQGDMRQAELTFPFDLVWLPNGASAFRRDPLQSILPMPEKEFAACADWYVVHLSALLGPVVSLEDVGAAYRVHGSNRHEPQAARLDLAHIRRTILYAAATAPALEHLGDELALKRPEGPILSVADVANRLISLKLAPALHPLTTDKVWSLARDGMRAATRRSDVSRRMKILFAGWFGSLALAPRPLARELAERFVFVQRRQRLNQFLGRMHRSNSASANRATPLS
jgi:GT2 family glycosyltransferase